MRWFANAGPDEGPALYRDVPASIGVLKGPGDPEPIGTALCVGRDDQGLALWRLVIQEAVVPGRWILIDREFSPAEPVAVRPSQFGP